MADSFYDELAPFYHLLYGDWNVAVSNQGMALATLLRDLGIEPGQAVLDAACGIGTQTLGLLGQGYRVTASDLSPGAIERLGVELSRRGLSAEVQAGFCDVDRRDNVLFQPVFWGRRVDAPPS